jgi:predicted PhzF superfamily epimerase YddE/YHI9
MAFAAPPMVRHEPVAHADLDRAMRLLGLTDGDVVASHWIDNGPGWMGLQLTIAQRVVDIPMPTEPAEHFDVGVVGLYPPGSDDAIEVRAFFNDPNGSIPEDPVTGSLNASIAQWPLGRGALTAPYAARQTSGLVHVSEGDGQIWVGGTATVRVSGSIDV